MSSKKPDFPPYLIETKNKAEIVTVNVHELSKRFDDRFLNSFKFGKSELRGKQLASSDWIIKNRIDSQAHIDRDLKGRPFLNTNEKHISISHTRELLCLIHHDENEVSIDIEFKDRDTAKIQSRFTDEIELKIAQKNFPDNPSLLVWSAKECLFKIIGKENIHFLSNLRIRTSSCENGLIKTLCEVRIHDSSLIYTVNSVIFEAIIVSYIDEPHF